MIQITDKQLFAQMCSLPKAEVHLHLDGAVPASDVFQMAQAKGVTLFRASRDNNAAPIAYADESDRVIADEQSLAEYWMDWEHYTIPDRFGIVTGLMQNQDEIVAISRAHVHSLHRQNIRYAETRFAPQYHLREGLSLERAIGYVLEGLAQGSEETGVIVKLIVCIGREIDGEASVAIARAALHFADCGVVALDLACFEPPYPPQLHRRAFELTFDSPLKRTVHAGEMCGSDEENLANVYTALSCLRADGIGHALPLHHRYYRQHDLVQMMVENGVRLESNPISNLVVTSLARIEDLYLDKLTAAGVRVTINSDDPAMWPNGSLAHNLYAVASLHGEHLVRLAIHNAVITAFGLDDAQKKALLKEFASSINS